MPDKWSNKRQSRRIGLCLNIQIQCEETADPIVVKSRDLSETGVFLETANHPCFPKIGQVVTLRVLDSMDGEPAPPVKARVVRITDEGIGLHFVEHE